MEEEIKPVDRVILYQLITHNGMIPISIGGNCYMKRWTEYVGVSQETHFFDYIGTRGYSLYQLLARDFQGLFDYQKYDVKRILQEPPGTFVSHHTYFLSFAHSFPGNALTPFAFQRFSSQYTRRLGRLKEILRGGGGRPVLFLRLEESKERYDDPYYRDVSEGVGEFEYLRRFSGLLREKYPQLNYKLLFVNSLPEYAGRPSYLEEYRILMIPKGEIDPNHWSTCHIDLSKIILQHYSFIHQIITG